MDQPATKFPGPVNDGARYGFILNQLMGTVFRIPQQKHVAILFKTAADLVNIHQGGGNEAAYYGGFRVVK